MNQQHTTRKKAIGWSDAEKEVLRKYTASKAMKVFAEDTRFSGINRSSMAISNARNRFITGNKNDKTVVRASSSKPNTSLVKFDKEPTITRLNFRGTVIEYDSVTVKHVSAIRGELTLS